MAKAKRASRNSGVSIGDDGVVLPSVLSFAQAGLPQGPQPKSQSPLLKRTSVKPVSNQWVGESQNRSPLTAMARF